MTGVDVARGRRAFDVHAWADSFDGLGAADARAGLDADDLERLGVAAHLVGGDDACVDAWERAHRRQLDRGEVAGAARCLFWLIFELLERGEQARAAVCRR